jgi:hypothetical protein
MNKTSFSHKLTNETQPSCSECNLVDNYCSIIELFKNTPHGPYEWCEFCSEVKNAKVYEKSHKPHELNEWCDYCDASQNDQQSSQSGPKLKEAQQKDQQLTNDNISNSGKTECQPASKLQN